MSHAELFQTANGGFRWLAFWEDRPAEVSEVESDTADAAYVAACRLLPLTVAPWVREGERRMVAWNDDSAMREAEALVDAMDASDEVPPPRRSGRRVAKRG